ncbi:bifunctional 2-polyprenyl-6-hydroxyphenol methylase/3-demethylubiquinol 3-O-methyltransferase UbiG [Clostridium estertheticum]|uniref:class I SAM-dependent methyltransferase n=1 Tax=Clostridium estertheticum TaxID=238834 RepID=UPI001C6F52F7|nr:class I SAM-dependent methyltransferase [Clostridium estertheticum]MBW9150736.1 class I SAM-dependent methyltransferase [Clostridium estertheticum]WLC84531.1 class I SAM-dependent methyltransferase [Clostridium estertheticum]
MNFDWNSDTIRWYQQANTYSGFFKNISDLIVPKLEGYSTLCDIGCGLGLIDLELSKNIKSITCIDINEKAIKSLEKSVKDRKITNIESHVLDYNDIDGKWDVIYVSFFGSINLKEFLPHCKKLIAIVNKKSSSKFCPEKHSSSKETNEKVEESLTNKGILYSNTEVSFEFGQPFAAIEEAKKFIRIHSPKISLEDLEKFLLLYLIETGDKEYPFYIPHMKSMDIFEIEGEL